MKRFIFALVVVWLGTAIACSPKNDSDTPMAAAKALLKLHHLLGKRPSDRTEKEKKERVNRNALKPFFADLEGRDPFLTDLYVGFVIGALAERQNDLVVNMDANRAKILAGGLAVWFEKKGGLWKIDLEATVPKEIKERALEEKKKTESRTEPR